MRYKLCKFCENRARDTGRLYSTFWSNLSKNFSFWGTPLSLHRWGEIWHGGGPPPCQIYPHRCNMSLLRGEKPQNRPLGKLNYRRLALRAMLPVNINRSNTDWMSVLLWLILLFYDLCGFWSVAVNTLYKLQVFAFMFVVLLPVLSSRLSG